MKFQLKFKGKILNGEFVPDQPLAYKNYLWNHEGKEVEATLKKFRAYKQRSNENNRYYWGVCVKLLADEWGYPKTEHDEVHDLIKGKLLMEVVEVKNGKRLFRIGSTASLSTANFMNFLSRLRMWASQEFSCYIPEPNEVPFEY